MIEDAPHYGSHGPMPTVVQIAPGVDLTLQQVVGVARGDGRGGYARVELSGKWREACQVSLDHLHESMTATAGKSVAELASLVRAHFARERAPSGLAELLAAPRSDEVDKRLASRALIYGVTTGFGVNKDRRVESIDQIHEMQVNLLRSHACGIGAPLPIEVIRATMLLRIRTFVEGHSCVRQKTVQLLCDLLNAGVHPWVPEQGSVGSSGDLCPLAHIALSLIGEGFAWRGGPQPPSHPPIAADRADAARSIVEVLSEVGLAGCVLENLAPKEGLALINGTCVATALAALATWDASVLLANANLAAAMSLQAALSCSRAFDPKVHRVRRHAGQAAAAAKILSHCNGSTLLDRSDDVQDAYSLRCAPAVHGAAWAAVDHVWSLISGEINAVTDNPLFFANEADSPPIDGGANGIWKAYSAGNFHGEPIGMAADYLKIAVAELASISERRTQALLDRHHNRGLPANLWPEKAGAASGLNSGLMIAQYAAASLVSENKTLAHPASVDSIPTSANIEDHNAMSTIAARHARRVVTNAQNVIGIELICAAQALELRLRSLDLSDSALSKAASRALRTLRDCAGIPFIETRDHLLWPYICAAAAAVMSGELVHVAPVSNR